PVPAATTRPQPQAPAPQVTTPAPGGQIAAAAPAVSGEQHLAHGDFGKAVEALGTAETPESLTKRGLARWLQYLQQKKQANAPLKAEDDAVAQAKKDLTDAKTAEGKYWLGHG